MFLLIILQAQQYPSESENKSGNQFIFPMPQANTQLPDMLAHRFGNRGNAPTDLNLTMNLGLGIQLKDSVEKLKCSSKERLDTLSYSNSTFPNPSIPKMETDLGYGAEHVGTV